MTLFLVVLVVNKFLDYLIMVILNILNSIYSRIECCITCDFTMESAPSGFACLRCKFSAMVEREEEDEE